MSYAFSSVGEFSSWQGIIQMERPVFLDLFGRAVYCLSLSTLVSLFTLQVHQILKTVQLSEEDSSKHRNVEGTRTVLFLIKRPVYKEPSAIQPEFKEFLQH